MADTADPTCPPATVQHAVDAFRRHAFAALLVTDAPRLADAAEAASREAVGVAQAIAWLDAHGALEHDGDRLVGAHGLTHRTTPHGLTVGDRTVHTWCALDAVAIPVALGATARATTSCPTCGRSLAVEIVDGQLPDRPQPVLWHPTGPCNNVIADFCAHANLFCTTEHLATWRHGAGNPPGHILTLAGVPAIARTAWADIATGEPDGS
ncbi:MAG: organomercurial lyase [Acidimicrobiales bacterium]